MSEWLEHTVQIEVAAPMDLVWDLWSDLEKMPLWMKWIDSVKVLEENPDLSRWKLATGGLEFSWQSRIRQQIFHQMIQWESVDGLPNRGAIRFYDRHGSSIVRLSVAYAIPGVLGKIMDRLFLGKAVENNLMESLQAFRDYAQAVAKPVSQPN
ncbi:SRPBCC family protein [Thermosynechococcaceae cyanobacterium BACA0444]|uniref:SRPBCC family protein n=1 Tax=Pseudocalidococcus azoricus BACA0444 TaxID=2918990 RepID=A0AAE4K0L8_9CYAN|nr:SRPBCC family protein [Pseudocalidococcus azoricus]MDS3862077.1 SRPBCC family protein [Pseudocalidococcus azoricus BACA0444]